MREKSYFNSGKSQLNLLQYFISLDVLSFTYRVSPHTFHDGVPNEHSVHFLKNYFQNFPGGAVVGSPPANAGDTGSSPGPGRSHMLRSN